MKTFKIILIVFCIIIFISHPILATDIWSKGDSFLEDGKSNTKDTMDTSKIKTSVSDVYNILLVIATGVAVSAGAILAIKYMTAGISEKVKVKESLFPYLISCVVVFGAMGIWKISIEIVKGFV